MPQHRLGGARSQHVGVVDVRAAGHDGVHQGQHLAPGQGATDAPHQAHRAVDELPDARRAARVATNNSPALAARCSSSKVTSMRSILRDTRFTGSASRAGANVGVRHRHRPSSGRLSLGCSAAQGAIRSVDRDLLSARYRVSPQQTTPDPSLNLKRADRMSTPFEKLTPDRFQELCQALLLREYPGLQCFPVGMADGGRDASILGRGMASLVFQVKFTREPTEVKTPAAWLESSIRGELSSIRRLVERGCQRYILLTNIRGTAPLDAGSIDRVQMVLDELIPVPAQCLWRDDIERRVESSLDIRAAIQIS
jgi:hypothetical protein